jgi:hypothetical protein
VKRSRALVKQDLPGWNRVASAPPPAQGGGALPDGLGQLLTQVLTERSTQNAPSDSGSTRRE